MKVPFGLAQAPAYFQELMTGILKDFPFAIAYLDNIIMFSKTPQEHLYIFAYSHGTVLQAYDHYLLKLTPYNI